MNDRVDVGQPKNNRFMVSSSVFYSFYLALAILFGFVAFNTAIMDEFAMLGVISLTPLYAFSMIGINTKKRYSVLISLIYVLAFLALRLVFLLFLESRHDVYTNINFDDAKNQWVVFSAMAVAMLFWWHVIVAIVMSILNKLNRLK